MHQPAIQMEDPWKVQLNWAAADAAAPGFHHYVPQARFVQLPWLVELSCASPAPSYKMACECKLSENICFIV